MADSEIQDSFNQAQAGASRAVPENVLKETTTYANRYYIPGGMGGAMPPPEQFATTTYVTVEDVYEILSNLSESDRGLLAQEMFVSVPGAYSSYEDIFNDDGSLNEVEYVGALSTTFSLASSAAAIDNPYFVDILTRETLSSLSREEIQTLFNQRVAEIKESEKAAPRVIRYIDPAALNGMLKDTYRGSIGRMPTDQEMRRFVQYIHGLQASNPDMQLSPGAQAAEFAAQQNPEEAKAMEYVNAGRTILSALGMGTR